MMDDRQGDHYRLIVALSDRVANALEPALVMNWFNMQDDDRLYKRCDAESCPLAAYLNSTLPTVVQEYIPQFEYDKLVFAVGDFVSATSLYHPSMKLMNGNDFIESFVSDVDGSDGFISNREAKQILRSIADLPDDNEVDDTSDIEPLF